MTTYGRSGVLKFWVELVCQLLDHKWSDAAGDLNIRFRECQRCQAREMSLFGQPWREGR